MRQHHFFSRTNIDIPENLSKPESDLMNEFLPRMRDYSLINFVTTTTSSKKNLIDMQLARYIYSNNTPFAAVEHPEFVQMLLPGYRLPSRYQIGGPLLGRVYDQIHEDCRQRHQDKIASMMLDGWSNIHNEPVVTSDGESYLIDNVDTSGYSYTAEYLQSVALASAIWKELEQTYIDYEFTTILEKVKTRADQALTPFNLLANLMDPTRCGRSLSTAEIDLALEYCAEHQKFALPTLINYRAKGDPFKLYMFAPNLLNKVSPIAWWESYSYQFLLK